MNTCLKNEGTDLQIKAKLFFFPQKEGSQSKLLDTTELEYPSMTYNLESSFALFKTAQRQRTRLNQRAWKSVLLIIYNFPLKDKVFSTMCYSL